MKFRFFLLVQEPITLHAGQIRKVGNKDGWLLLAPATNYVLLADKRNLGYWYYKYPKGWKWIEKKPHINNIHKLTKEEIYEIIKEIAKVPVTHDADFVCYLENIKEILVLNGEIEFVYISNGTHALAITPKKIPTAILVAYERKAAGVFKCNINGWTAI